jgi:putative transposase
MARPIRIEFTGALYYITARVDQQEDIFLSDQDRVSFLNIIKNTADRFNGLIYAHFLMNNHYHLLIETPDSNLSKGMHQLNSAYTQAIRESRPVFQGAIKQYWFKKKPIR